MIRKAAAFIFFGNYFLGLCIAVLSFETLIQFGFRRFDCSYFLLVFLLTVVYYTHAYRSEINIYKGNNLRIRWYVQNKLPVRQIQSIHIAIIIAAGTLFCNRHFDDLLSLSAGDWLMLLFFPLLALLYYGVVMRRGLKFSLRQYGWLKPFIIGLVATGTIAVYPLILFRRIAPAGYASPLHSTLFFTADFIFTSVIALMFDIKDYAGDHNHRLKTWVVQFGLRKTIYYVFLPLTGAGLSVILAFAYSKNDTIVQQVLLAIPFILLGGVAWSLQQRKKILYYLAVIDGLLLVKAICGIAAGLFFKQ